MSTEITKQHTQKTKQKTILQTNKQQKLQQQKTEKNQRTKTKGKKQKSESKITLIKLSKEPKKIIKIQNENTMDKHRSTTHCTENLRLSNMNPTNILNQ